MGLREYKKKRDFSATPEPAGAEGPARRGTLRYVIQKHDATRLHYDFRLEWDGVLKSWAVPKGPSLDPAEKRLAVQVEDHPIEYGSFEGTIPKGQYGGGTVLLWDKGTWEPEGDAAAGLKAGKLKFTLHGKKLRGRWMLLRMGGRRWGGDNGRVNWLLVKEKDQYASTHADVLSDEPLSVKSGRELSEIAGAKRGKVWQSKPREKPESARWRPAALKPREEGRAREERRQKTETDPRPSGGAGALPGAVRAVPPRVVHPQLARLVDHVPADAGWFHEIKFDGYRILAVRERGKVRLITRKGKDWSERFPELRAALEARDLPDGVLDGELVALDDKGLSDFQSLQNALKNGATGKLVYFAFDVPYWDGYDLTGCALADRSALLERALGNGSSPNGRIRLSQHIRGKGERVFDQACRRHLEGIISKRADSHYEGARTGSWVKTKCGNRQEFVIGGYTEPRRSRHGFGSLLLGYYEDGRLVYAGKVGTGFDSAELDRLIRRMEKIETKDCPYATRPTGPEVRGAHWIKPELVAEVAFTEWTNDGRLRHPSYQGLREDKPAREVVRETVKPAPRARVEEPPARVRSAASPVVRGRSSGGRKAEGRSARASEPAARADRPRAGRGGAQVPTETGRAGRQDIGGVSLSHPDRVVYPGGLSKADVAAYYARIGKLMMPHLSGRPVSIVRCPSGGNGPCFFQKHVDWGDLPGLTSVPIEDSKGKQEYLIIQEPVGLVSLVQMNCLEIHAWGALGEDPERADRLVMDLDPGEGVKWPLLVEIAKRVRTSLAAAGIKKTFVKTTGGRGIHIVAPLSPPVDWDVLKPWARALAERLAAADPKNLTSVMSKAQRPGRIYIDYLRNGRGATSVAPYSTRAKGAGTVSMPVRWEELARVKPGDFTVETVPRIVQKRTDPWQGFERVRQAIKQP